MTPSVEPEVLARVNFPLYTVKCVTERHIMVAGGGGMAKTGIDNVIVSIRFKFIMLMSYDLCYYC